MDESLIEVIERPSTPAEAKLHHEIETLKKEIDGLCQYQHELNYSFEKRLRDLEASRRPGDD